MNRQTLLNTFNDTEEKFMFARILDIVSGCRDKVFSDFLDPAKISRFTELLKSQRDFSLNILSFGGQENCERKMLGFAPEYIELETSNFPIGALEIVYNTNFSRSLTHRDFLGSIMGLGIDRSKVGDIILAENGSIVFISEEMLDYVCTNLEKVGNTKVTASITELKEYDTRRENVREKRITVSSLRIDNIISAVFNMSRSKSAGLITGEKVYINWKLVVSGSKQISENDNITLRGVGRVKIKEIIGTTKKDRIAIIVQI